MKLSLSEEAYTREFYKAYNTYGNNIPDAEWQRLSELRAICGINMGRVREIINAVQEGTIVPAINDEYSESYRKSGNDIKVIEEVTKEDRNIIAIFQNGVTSLLSHSNNNDCLILNISDSDKSLVRNNFGLALDEQILWVRDTSFWGNKNQGLVITDKQIVYIPNNDNPKDRLNIDFNDIQHVEYREMSLFVWNYQEEYYKLHLSLFFKNSEESSGLIADAKTLANTLTEMAKSVGHVETETVFDHISNLLNEKKYDEVADCAKQIVSDADYDNNAKCLGYVYLADALSQKGYLDEDKGMNSYMRDAVEACDCALELCGSANPYRYKIFNKKGQIELLADDMRSARSSFIAAMESDDYDQKKEAKNLYEKLTNEFVRDECKFINADYNDRKFLFTVASDKQIPGCYDKEDNVQWVFSILQIPSYINFPIGHPQPNTLYMGHPLKPGVYIPFENATEQLFMEKVRELCYLAQCLGAVEIRFKRIKGREVTTADTSSKRGAFELARKLVEVGVGIELTDLKTETQTSNNGVELVQRYSPIKKPFCPEGMVWYDSDPTWQTLVKQRLNGNILSYVEHVSSSETTTVSSSQLMSLKASLGFLVAKASGSYDSKTDKTFSKTEETEWEIDMQFKPLQDFDDANASNGQAVAQIAQTQNSELSEDELAYKEEVEFCLEDAPEIDAHSRKFLERKRQKLGISEARAKELEDMVTASQLSFTDEEKEYMEALDDVIEDGAIPNNVRRLLERERRSLGISEERAKELEDIKCKA